MVEVNNAELLRLAKEASQGDWQSHLDETGEFYVSCPNGMRTLGGGAVRSRVCEGASEADAAFIAAVSPAVVLDFLAGQKRRDELEELFLCAAHSACLPVGADAQQVVDAITGMQRTIAGLRAEFAWVPVSERLPASGRTVLAFYINSVGRVRRIRAQYVERWTIEVDAATADPDTECVEYSESADAFYLLEGWYECIDNWDDYTRIAVTEGQVSHWMPLPAAPAEVVGEVQP